MKRHTGADMRALCSSVMKRTAMRLHTPITIALCLLSGLGLSGQTRSPEAELKAAQHREHVEGDLKGAIEQYSS